MTYVAAGRFHNRISSSYVRLYQEEKAAKSGSMNNPCLFLYRWEEKRVCIGIGGMKLIVWVRFLGLLPLPRNTITFVAYKLSIGMQRSGFRFLVTHEVQLVTLSQKTISQPSLPHRIFVTTKCTLMHICRLDLFGEKRQSELINRSYIELSLHFKK